MTWEQAVLLRILGGSVLAPIVFRSLGDVPLRERVYRIMLQYAWAIVIALLIALVFGFTLSNDLWPIFWIGMLMPLGVSFQWKATVISTSRVGIFMEGTNVLPLLMSAVLLGEWRVFEGNAPLLVGFALIALGVGLQARKDIREKQEKEAGATSEPSFLRNALGFMIIFAVATFLENFWAKTGIQPTQFLVAWYTGAFVGSVVFWAFTRRLPKSKGPAALSAWKEQVLIFLAGVSIVASLALAFVALMLVEQVVAQPVMAVGGVVGPALVGMFLFREWKKYHGATWLYFALAIVGALVMAMTR